MLPVQRASIYSIANRRATKLLYQLRTAQPPPAQEEQPEQRQEEARIQTKPRLLELPKDRPHKTGRRRQAIYLPLRSSVSLLLYLSGSFSWAYAFGSANDHALQNRTSFQISIHTSGRQHIPIISSVDQAQHLRFYPATLYRMTDDQQVAHRQFLPLYLV